MHYTPLMDAGSLRCVCVCFEGKREGGVINHQAQIHNAQTTSSPASTCFLPPSRATRDGRRRQPHLSPQGDGNSSCCALRHPYLTRPAPVSTHLPRHRHRGGWTGPWPRPRGPGGPACSGCSSLSIWASWSRLLSVCSVRRLVERGKQWDAG